MKALSAAAFADWIEQGVIVIDTRDQHLLKQGFIKGSITFSSIEKFKEHAGAFLGFSLNSGFPSVLLVCDESEKDKWEDPILQSGIDLKGYLAGGFDTWIKAGGDIDMVIDVEADELMMDIPFDENLVVMDIRPAIAYGGGHLKEAISLPLDHMADPLRLSAIEDKDNLYIVGNNDEEAFLAATVLKKHDIHNLRVVLGGWDAVAKQQKAEVVKDPGLLN